LLTEAQVQKSFLKMVVKAELNEELFEKVEELLENLRPESPLRHRLHGELEELRRLATAK
jgi:hypothetical protein